MLEANPLPAAGAAAILESKQKLTDNLIKEIRAVADSATEADKRMVTELQNRARSSKSGEGEAAVYNLSPPVCAILFLDHNPHNRDWAATKSLGFAQEMRDKEWQFNSNGGGFYINGDLADMQHRLAAAALASYTLRVTITFGVPLGAVVTTDVGTKRRASEAAKLDGILDGRIKEQTIRSYSGYMAKTDKNFKAFVTDTQRLAAIKANDDILNLAIEIGAGSANVVGVRSDPRLRQRQAISLTYIMLKHGWPEQKVRERLNTLQTGMSDTDAENDPLYLAADLVAASNEKTDRSARLQDAMALGLVLFALVQTELGKTFGKRVLQNNVKPKGEMPNPEYPHRPGSRGV